MAGRYDIRSDVASARAWDSRTRSVFCAGGASGCDGLRPRGRPGSDQRMSEIGKKLREAMAEQRRPRPERRPAADHAQVEAAFRPVFEAAQELRRELSGVHELEISVLPDHVRIELYDRDLWFSYSPEARRFIGSELTSLWMEGGPPRGPALTFSEESKTLGDQLLR